MTFHPSTKLIISLRNAFAQHQCMLNLKYPCQYIASVPGLCSHTHHFHCCASVVHNPRQIRTGLSQPATQLFDTVNPWNSPNDVAATLQQNVLFEDGMYFLSAKLCFV